MGMALRTIIFGVTTPYAARQFLAGVLGKVASQGHRVVLICPYDIEVAALCRAESAIYEPIDLKRNPSPIDDLESAWKLFRTIRRYRPDVTVFGTPKISLLGGFASWVQGVPNRIYVVHGLRSSGSNGLKRMVLRAFESMTLLLATDAIAVSPSLANEIERTSLFRRDVRVILDGSPNGIDTEYFRPPSDLERATARQKRGLEDGNVVVGFVGRLAFDKGVTDLADMAELARRRHPEFRFLVAGSNEGEARCEAAIRSLEADENVAILGNVDDVRSVYWALDVLIHPSYREGLGLSLVEAVACGVPVVARNIVGCRDVIQDEQDGALLESRSREQWLKKVSELSRSSMINRDARFEAASRMRARFARSDVANAWARHLVSITPESKVARRLGHLTARRVYAVTVFSEARLGFGPDGTLLCNSRNMSGSRWKRDLDGINGLHLCARLDKTPGNVDAKFAIDAPGFIAVPYYRGGRELAKNALEVTLAVASAVRSSRTIVVQMPSSVGMIAGFVNLVLRRPMAVDVMGDIGGVIESVAIGADKLRLGELLARRAAKLIVRKAQAVRYMTQNTLQNELPAASAAVSISCSSVELGDEWFAEKWDRQKCADGREFRVIAVGSHDQLYKGHDTLIRAAAEARARGSNWHLSLVGEGRYTGNLRAMAESLGVSDRVSFDGYVGDPCELRQKLLSSDLFAMPSRTEGLPRALIEAMALGMPCIGSTAGGIPELLGPDCLFAPEDLVRLVELIELAACTEGLRTRWSERNRTVALTYSKQSLEPRREEWRAAILDLGMRNRHVEGGLL